jgi:2-haloacid dehalogenase
MVSTVLLDLDDTILDFHASERVAISQTLGEMGIEPTEGTLARYSEINAAQWRLLERGEMTRDQILTRRFQLLFDELGVGCDARQARTLYEGHLSEGHVFIPGAEQLLEELSPRYALYLVSNGTATVQQRRLTSAGIVPYFRALFISEQVGYVKPQKEFFDACFAQIGEEKRAESVIVGDSLSSDILGGRNAGIRTIWFNPGGKPANPAIHADRELRTLAALPALLASM